MKLSTEQTTYSHFTLTFTGSNYRLFRRGNVQPSFERCEISHAQS